MCDFLRWYSPHSVLALNVLTMFEYCLNLASEWVIFCVRIHHILYESQRFPPCFLVFCGTDLVGSYLHFFMLLLALNVLTSITLCKPLLFVHFMPWFELNPLKHWPDNEGMYYVPYIDYYNSADENVINWQLSLMSKAGINGIMVYWLGSGSNNPHQNQLNATNILWKIIKNNYTNLKLSICIDNADISTNQDAFIQDLQYLKSEYFGHSSYLTYTDNNPIITIFPNTGWNELTPQSINNILKKANVTNTYVYSNWKSPSYHMNFTGNNYDNLGVYNWVYPQHKNESDKDEQINQCKQDNVEFYEKAKNDPYKSKFYIGSIYHGFSDHYIDKTTDTTNPYNRNGFINEDYDYLQILYNDTMENKYDPYIIQIPTWNDYTEGTMIEPNIPTKGCIKGCDDDTKSNPYNDLITIYKLFVDANANSTQLQEEFEEITRKYFPNL